MPQLNQGHQPEPKLRDETKRMTCLRVQCKVLRWRAAQEQRADEKLGEQKQGEREAAHDCTGSNR